MQKLFAAITTGVLLTLCLLMCVFEVNSATTYHVVQKMNGEVMIRDKPGLYYSGWSTITPMDRTVEMTYAGADATKVTFYDNGKADLDSYIRFELPTSEEKRLLLHAKYLGNIDSVKNSVHSHVKEVLRRTATCMSASEHQTSRQPEFNDWVERQIREGVWKMKSRTLTIDTPAGGSAEEVAASEVDKQNGTEVIAKASPLAAFDLNITQFNLIGTKYDEKTEIQFDNKKTSYLNAEKAKVEKDEEIFQREKIIAQGLRELAEIEKEQNKTKMIATVAADREAEVAVIKKEQAVTIASQKVAVAEQDRLEAEKLKDIAQIKAETAELDKRAAIALAEAKQKAIELGGTISEEKRILAEIACKQAVGEAEAWAKRPMPATVIMGGADGGNTLEQLLSMSLLKHNGLTK